jgi:Lysyl oxidase
MVRKESDQEARSPDMGPLRAALATRVRQFAGLILVSFGVILSTAGVASAAELLPDMDQLAPSNLNVQSVGSEEHLGFDSTVQNVGAGPLRIQGSRSSTTVSDMTASQIVDQSGGGSVTYSAVGVIRYVVGGGHSHWHLLNFESYELHRTDGSTVGRDRKTGFCLGYLSPDNCGFGQPDLLQVSMGLAVGGGDTYRANLEGQYIDITGLPAGVYVLVHRSNPGGTLRESSLANDAASLRIRLRYPHGRVKISTLATCPDSATC